MRRFAHQREYLYQLDIKHIVKELSSCSESQAALLKLIKHHHKETDLFVAAVIGHPQLS